MNPGLTHDSTVMVGGANTARAMGSGDLDVLATPAMIALMENAAMLAVAPALDAGMATVGTVINVVHTRATPVGQSVTATATLQEADGRRLVFHVVARDPRGVVGEGVHERFVVDRERFLGKL